MSIFDPLVIVLFGTTIGLLFSGKLFNSSAKKKKGLFTIKTKASSSFISKRNMQIIISILVLLASLYIILSKQYDETTQKWATGAIGSVIGFWFGSSKDA